MQFVIRSSLRSGLPNNLVRTQRVSNVKGHGIFSQRASLSYFSSLEHRRQRENTSTVNLRPIFGAIGALATVATFSSSALTEASTEFNQSGKSFQKEVTLYQYEVCPYCNKVKAFLDYHGIPYRKVEVNPLSKEEIKFSEYKMVPFAVIEDHGQVNGSGDIIQYLSKAALERGEASADPEVNKWVQWVDDWLVHLLPPNIYRTPSEALQAFHYITEQSNFSFWGKLSSRYAGAGIMYMIAKKAKSKYGVSDDARKDLYEAAEKWASEGVSSGRFHGGSSPDEADLAVFGVLRAIDGDIGSLKYDTWSDLKKHDSPGMETFWTWYYDMQKVTPAPNLIQD